MGRSMPQCADIAGDWRRYRSLLRGAERRHLTDADWEIIFGFEQAVLTGRIHSLQDATAKLNCVRISFVQGERVDRADVRALDQVIHWLDAQALAEPPERGISALIEQFRGSPPRLPSPFTGDWS